MREIPLGNFMKSLLLGTALTAMNFLLTMTVSQGLFGNPVVGPVLDLIQHIGLLYLVFELADRVELARKRQNKKTPWLLSSTVKSVIFGLLQGIMLVVIFAAIMLVAEDAVKNTLTSNLGVGTFLKYVPQQMLRFFLFCCIAKIYAKRSEGRRYP